MSELAYTRYLKQINARLEYRTINLGIDLSVDYMHLIDQLNVLDQYLYYNNSLLTNKQGGFNDLCGFESLTVCDWNRNNNEKEHKKLLERHIRNILYTRTPELNNDCFIKLFDTENINYIIDEDDLDLFDDVSTENIIEENINNLSSSSSSSPSITPQSFNVEVDSFTERELGDEQICAEYNYETKEDDYIEEETDDETPLLGDMYNDLVEASRLLDEDEEDDYGFSDEYAIFEEKEIEDSFTDNNEEYSYTEEDIVEDFEFTGGQETSIYKRDIRTTDKVVDKTTDLVNQGLNSLLRKLAGK